MRHKVLFKRIQKKMKQENIEVTLGNIRSIMENSTRVLSLNGGAALVVGILACLTAAAAYSLFGGSDLSLEVNSPIRYKIILIGAALLLAISVGITAVLSATRARRLGKRLTLDRPTRKMLWSFALPLITGGALCLIFILQARWGLTSSLMLVFYGLALFNASNYTHSDSRYLAYAFIAIGLVDAVIEGHALLFWTLGFGILHIVYGIYFIAKHRTK